MSESVCIVSVMNAQRRAEPVQVVQGTCRLVERPAAYAGATDAGRVRRCNEDSLLLLPEAGMFAVADGLGGLDAGDVASRTAIEHLRHLGLSRGKDPGKDALSDLGATIAAVNYRTYEQRLALGKNMATTLALVRFTAVGVLTAHVGDSRIYRWRGGKLTRLTSDHSLVNALCEQGALTASQARVSPQRHIITRAIGAESTVSPSVQQIELLPGDLVLLCTDGLTSMVTDEAIAACFEADGADPGLLVEHLVHRANDAGGHDNITVVIVAL